MLLGERPMSRIFASHSAQVRPARGPAPPFRRKPIFEALEQRLLLSADPVPFVAEQLFQQAQAVVAAELLDPSLPQLIGLSGGERDTLVGANTGNLWQIVGPNEVVLNGVSYSAVANLVGATDRLDTFEFFVGGSLSGAISGGPGGGDVVDYSQRPDSIVVDLAEGTATGTAGVAGIEHFVGGAGEDVLRGPDADNTWNVTGANAGDVAGVSFDGFENLNGAVDNEDTFVFAPAGGLTGVVDGGAGGFDSLVMMGGTYRVIVYTATGPQSGVIDADGSLIRYDGLEPVSNSGTATDIVFNLTANADEAVLEDAGGNSSRLRSVNGTFESTTFTNPSGSVTINLGSGADRFTIDALDDTLFTGSVILDAGDADDDITLAVRTTGVSYTLDGGAGTHDAIHFDATGAVTISDTDLDGITLGGIERAFLSGTSITTPVAFSGQVFFYENGTTWQEEGPNPYTSDLTGANRLWDPVAGAVQAVVVDPTDRFTTYIATGNGGVWRNTGGTEVFFATNESILTADDKLRLDDFAKFLEAHPAYTVEIGGHTDSSGLAGDNQALSVDRATSVFNYLVNTRHIDAGRLRTVGFGETRPVAENDANGVQALNRRVELLVDNWEPLTDDFPSLSVASLAMSPLDNKVLYAGLGQVSSSRTGGIQNGLLFSNDGGDTWRILGRFEFNGLAITKVLPTSITTASGDQVVLVSTFDVDRDGDGNLDDEGGLFRLEVKPDGTATSIQKISNPTATAGLPSGHYTDVAMDPGGNGRPVRLYTASPSTGVFRSEDGGVQWQLLANGFALNSDSDNDGSDDLLQGTQRIKLAVDPLAGVVWAGVIGPTTNGLFNAAGTGLGLVGLMKLSAANVGLVDPVWQSIPVPTSQDGPGLATTLGLHASGQGDLHFSIATDPTDGNIVYAGGDTQTFIKPNENGAGLQAFAGRIFRLNPADSSWTQIVGTTAGGTAPHADSRFITFANDFTLIEADDGGIYRLQNPRAEADQGTTEWASLNRGIRINESTHVAFDPLNGTLMAGTQDNGSAHQAGIVDGIDNDNDGVVDETDERFFWSGMTAGDGNSQIAIPIDVDGVPGADRVLRYSLSNNLRFLDVYEFDANGQQIDANGNPSATRTRIQFASPGGGAFISGLNNEDQAFTQFTQIPMVVNRFNPLRVAIGLHGIYESVNTNVTPGPNRVLPLDRVQLVDPNGPGVAVGFANAVTALVYGGAIGNTQFQDLIVAARASTLVIRQTAGGAVTQRVVDGAGTITGVAVDPNDWRKVYVTAGREVFRIDDVTDAGKAWVNITGNSRSLFQTNLRTIEYVRNQGGQDVLLVGGTGGVTRLFDPGTAGGNAVWARLGENLPSALVSELKYIDAADADQGKISSGDLLIAGTMGRGVWTVGGDILSLAQPTTLRIFGSNSASAGDDLSLSIDDANPLLLDVSDVAQGVSVYSTRFAAISKVEIDTRAGDDSITVDHSHGGVAVPGGIVYRGGAGTNDLTLTGGPVGTITTDTSDPLFTTTRLVDTRGRPELVSFEKTTVTADTSAIPGPLDQPFDTVSGALEQLVSLLTFVKDLGKDLPFFGNTLGRALNGVDVEPGSPVGGEGGEAAGEEAEGGEGPVESQAEQVVDESSQAVDLLRRFIETGHGAFSLDSIASFTTLDQLRLALLGLDESGSGTVTIPVQGATVNDPFEFKLTGIKKSLTGRANVELNVLGGAIDLSGLVDVTADVTLNLVFGVDASHGFYIKASGSANDIVVDNIRVNAVEGDEVEAEGKFGFLGVEMSAASLAMDPLVKFTIDLDDTGTLGADGYITLSELTANGSQYVKTTLTGNPAQPDVTLTGTFKVQAFVPGEAAPFSLVDARATFKWADINAANLNSSPNLTVEATVGSPAGDALLSFLKVNGQQVFDQLKVIRDKLDTLANAADFVDFSILKSALDNILKVVDDFNQALVDPLGTLYGGAATIPTVQDLVTRIAQILGVDADELGLAYDQATGELTYHLDLTRQLATFSDALKFGFNFEPIADFNIDANASFDASIGVDFTFGVDLGDLAGGATVADSFFVRDASVSADATITALDINAIARLGFLDVSVQHGSLVTTTPISFAVALKDPDGTNKGQAGDTDGGRITLKELGDNLLTPGNLIQAPTIGGGLEATLPLAASFLGVSTATADTTLTVTVPDISDPSTISVGFPAGASIQKFLDFRNMNAAQFVSLIAGLASKLQGLRDTQFFKDIDIPFVQGAVNGVLDFTGSISRGLLYDPGADAAVDDAKRLATDINDALASAGLDRKIVVQGEGTKLKFEAIDYTISELQIAKGGGDGGGYNDIWNVSTAFTGAKFYETPTGRPAALGNDAELTFTLKRTGLDDEVVTVKIKKADTTDNTALGDDTIKLVGANNAATFESAQGLAARLVQILGSSLVQYVADDPNTADVDESAITVALGTLLPKTTLTTDLPIDFNLDLGSVIGVESNSIVRISAEAGFDQNFIIGAYLGDTVPGAVSSLQGGTLLSSLNDGDGVDISTSPAITAPDGVIKTYGRLSGDASFSLTTKVANVETTAGFTVKASDTATNTTTADLVADINAALGSASVRGAPISTFVLSGDATFDVKIGATTTSVTVLKADTDGTKPNTTANASLADLVADINTALTNAGIADKILAEASATVIGTGATAQNVNVIVLRNKAGTNEFSVKATNDSAKKELKLPAVETTGKVLSTLVTAVADGNRIGLVAKPSVDALSLTTTQNDVAVKDLGFQTSMTARGPLVGSNLSSFVLQTGDALFSLEFGGNIYDVTVKASDTADNGTDITKLVSDVNSALANAKNRGTGLTQSVAGSIQARASGAGIALWITNANVTSVKFTAAIDNATVTELGLADEDTFTPLLIAATKEVPLIVGRISADTTLDFSINGAAAIPVMLYADDTATNTTVLNLVADINQALDVPSIKTGTLSSFVLASDVTFTVQVSNGNGSTTKQVTVFKADTDGTKPNTTANTKLSDLVGDINAALKVQGLDTLVVAKPSGASSATGHARIRFDGTSDAAAPASTVTRLEITASANNALNLPTGRVAQRLSDKIKVDSIGNQLVFLAVDPLITAFNLQQVQGGLPELGLATLSAGALTADNADLLITVSNKGAGPASYKVTLDGLTTVQQVIDKIAFDTNGKVTAAINGAHTGLTLTDTTFLPVTVDANGKLVTNPNASMLSVIAINGSKAAIGLGISGVDSLSAANLDGKIDGKQVSGIKLTDRFFMQNAGVGASLTITTPELDANKQVIGPSGIDALANFGFVGVSLTGGGTLSGSIHAGFKDPSTSGPGHDGRVSLTEFIDGLGNISTLLETPTITGDGSITLDVDVKGVPFADPATAQIKFDLFNLGDLFDKYPNNVTGLPAAVRTGDTTFTLAGDFTSAFAKGAKVTVGSFTTFVTNVAFANGTTTVTTFGPDPADYLPNDLSGLAIGTPIAPALKIRFDNFENLLAFKNPGFDFDSILDALLALRDFLNQFDAASGVLSTPIPLVNVSVNDLLNFADKFSDALENAKHDPAGTLQILDQKISEAFGVDPSPPNPADDLLKFELDDNGTVSDRSDDIIKFEFNLSAAFSKSLNIDIPGLNLPAPFNVVDFGGGANLAASGSASFKLDMGVGLADPTKVYLYDSSGIAGSLNLSGSDMAFRVGLGPLGLSIIDGEASIAGAIASTWNASAGIFDSRHKTQLQAGSFGSVLGALDATLTAPVNVTLPVYFPTESHFVGDITLSGNLTDIANGLYLKTDSSAAPANTIVLDVSDVLVDLTSSFSNLSLLDQILFIVDGVDLVLGGVQDALDGEILGVDLPLIGDKLADGAHFIGDLRSGFLHDFRDQVEKLANPDDNGIKDILYNLLGPAGLGLLLSTDAGHNAITNPQTGEFVPGTKADIRTFNNLSQVNSISDADIWWKFKIGRNLVNTGGDLGLDLGIPGFGLKTDGQVKLDIDWQLDLGFGLSGKDGFYFFLMDPDTGIPLATRAAAPELQMTAKVTLPGASLSGELGFLEFTAVNKDVDGDPNDNNTHLAATFGVNIRNSADPNDQRLGLSELGKLGFDVLVGAEASAELGMTLGIAGDQGGFPQIQADFLLDWAIDGDPDQAGIQPISLFSPPPGFSFGRSIQDGLKIVEFRNVSLDVGAYLSDVVGPIVRKVQEVTEPVQPIIDIITTPLPVLHDLGLDITLLDIAKQTGAVDAGFIDSLQTILEVVSTLNSVDFSADGSLLVPFGNFTVFDRAQAGLFGTDFDLGSGSFDLDDFANKILGPNGPLKGLISGLPSGLQGVIGDVAGVASDVLKGLAEQNGAAGSGKKAFTFPILEDPSQVFGMLMGKPAVLIGFDMAPLDFKASFTAFFSIFGPLGVSINLDAALHIDFAFGYDTQGFIDFADSGFKNPLLLADGLYVSDDPTDPTYDGSGDDPPELTFDGGLWAAAELNLGIARGGVGGGIFIGVDFNLFDPNDDGRIRLDELVGNFLNQLKAPNEAERFLAPLAIFDVTGKITAELFAFLKIDFGFFTLDKKFEITPPVTLAEFDVDFFRPPVLATELDNGDLILNIGDFSKQRVLGDLTDFGENIHVEDAGPGKVAIWSDNLEDAGSDAKQIYSVTGKIIASGGEGDDVIDLSGVHASNIRFDLSGGAGKDKIWGTAGGGVMRGGTGDDDLHGGDGMDLIFGNEGSDEIHAGKSADIVLGDGGTVSDGFDLANRHGFVRGLYALTDGADTLYGDDDDDILIGSGGIDTIDGGANNDLVIGDSALLTFNSPPVVTETDQDPQAFKDILKGGTENDVIYGGLGGDEIYGEAGNDLIYGSGGADTIDAGANDDVVFGDPGTFLNGDLNKPVVIAGGEGDTIHGGSGSDKLLGGGGNDTIHGDDNDDYIWGGTGADTLYGDNGSDTILGESDPDKLYGDDGSGNAVDGDDTLEGGQGNDFVRGGRGVDVLIAGYGSDDLDGQEGSDFYTINARGGTTSEVTIAYDTGTGLDDSDRMTVFGTGQADTFLLRAMADYYFPTKERLQGVSERMLIKAALIEEPNDQIEFFKKAITSAYGPWDPPPAMLAALDALKNAPFTDAQVKSAVDNNYVEEKIALNVPEATNTAFVALLNDGRNQGRAVQLPQHRGPGAQHRRRQRLGRAGRRDRVHYRQPGHRQRPRAGRPGVPLPADPGRPAGCDRADHAHRTRRRLRDDRDHARLAVQRRQPSHHHQRRRRQRRVHRLPQHRRPQPQRRRRRRPLHGAGLRARRARRTASAAAPT